MLRRIILVSLIALNPGTGVAQQSSALPPATARAGPAIALPGASVTPAGDGDSTITYPTSAGPRSFRFVPATKTDPGIVVDVARDSQTGHYVYQYRFSNGQNARQRLSEIKMTVRGLRGAAVEAPRGWRADATPSRDLLTWTADAESDGRRGLAIGIEAAGFHIEATPSNLPGPSQATCRGDVVTTLPADLPQETRLSLERLGNFLVVWTLVPLISSGDGEPDLTPDVLTARVMGAYSHALTTSEHKSRTELVAKLNEAIELLSSDTKGGAAKLSQAREMAVAAGPDGWSRSLGQGLALCIDFIKARFGL